MPTTGIRWKTSQGLLIRCRGLTFLTNINIISTLQEDVGYFKNVWNVPIPAEKCDSKFSIYWLAVFSWEFSSWASHNNNQVKAGTYKPRGSTFPSVFLHTISTDTSGCIGLHTRLEDDFCLVLNSLIHIDTLAQHIILKTTFARPLIHLYTLVRWHNTLLKTPYALFSIDWCKLLHTETIIINTTLSQ